MFPVLAHLEMTGKPVPGGVAEIVASITAWIPGEELAWSLEVPPELRVVGGPITWSGQLKRGETRTFEISVLVPDAAHHEITAVLRSAERSHVRSAATLSLDPGGFAGPRATEEKVTSEGGEYIQYRGTVIPR